MRQQRRITTLMCAIYLATLLPAQNVFEMALKIDSIYRENLYQETKIAKRSAIYDFDFISGEYQKKKSGNAYEASFDKNGKVIFFSRTGVVVNKNRVNLFFFPIYSTATSEAYVCGVENPGNKKSGKINGFIFSDKKSRKLYFIGYGCCTTNNQGLVLQDPSNLLLLDSNLYATKELRFMPSSKLINSRSLVKNDSVGFLTFKLLKDDKLKSFDGKLSSLPALFDFSVPFPADQVRRYSPSAKGEKLFQPYYLYGGFIVPFWETETAYK